VTVTDVNLSSNRILKIPDDIYRLMKCTHLNLTQNRISTMPESLGRMSSLTKLNINANRIEEIHPGLAMCSTLKDLRLSGNRIRMLPLVRASTRLSEISLLHIYEKPLNCLYCDDDSCGVFTGNTCHDSNGRLAFERQRFWNHHV